MSDGDNGLMAIDAPDRADLEPAIRAQAHLLVAHMPSPRLPAALRLEERVMQAIVGDRDLRAALFRLLDVRPACAGSRELVAHLEQYLKEARSSPPARRLASVAGLRSARLPAAAITSVAVSRMAHRFIIGEDAAGATATLAALWQRGIGSTVDLLGEATVTEAEGRRYAARCRDVLTVLGDIAPAWPARPVLEHDDQGALPRVNLSVKVSALTPHLRPNAPVRGADGAREQLRSLLRLARDTGAHLHVDMESLDSREAVTRLTLDLLAEPEFGPGPSAGIVLQGYLADSGCELDRLLTWTQAHPREHPLAIRLVKGAYWDHEVVQATQNGWPIPVFTQRRACDRQFELLTRRLLDARAGGAAIRVAIASHNLRSIAHAMVHCRHAGLPVDALELQVLRGLGDPTAAAIAAAGWRARTYCPVGDLVAGMAYLVRRLLENTSNDSFLAAYAGGGSLDSLLEKP